MWILPAPRQFPSMGLAATPADISALQAKTPDNCAFACHQHTYDKKNKITGDDTSDYYHVARNNNVTLRIDVLRTATQALTQTATNAAIIASQFRMGVYEFSDTLATIAAPNADLAAVGTAANAIDLAYSYQDQRDSQTSYDRCPARHQRHHDRSRRRNERRDRGEIPVRRHRLASRTSR